MCTLYMPNMAGNYLHVTEFPSCRCIYMYMLDMNDEM